MFVWENEGKSSAEKQSWNCLSDFGYRETAIGEERQNKSLWVSLHIAFFSSENPKNDTRWWVLVFWGEMKIMAVFLMGSSTFLGAWELDP